MFPAELDPRFAEVAEHLGRIDSELPVRVTIETWRRVPNGGSGWERRVTIYAIPGAGDNPDGD